MARLGAALSVVVRAQDLESRAYADTPVGMNILIANYAYSEGGVSTGGSLPIQGAELTQNSFVLGYARSLNVFGKSGGDRPRTSFFRNCEKREVTPSLHDQPSQCYRLEKLELQQSLRIHYCRASGMPIMRLARCLRWAVRFDAVRLHRNVTSIHRNGRQFHSERTGPVWITTRRANLSKCFCSSFQ